MARKRPVILVSFSGIDGAGKSTQIEALHKRLTDARMHVTVFSMWDDIVVAPQVRESLSRAAFGGDQGVGSPENPLERRDKNVGAWPMQFFRFLLYFADAVSLSFKVRSLKARGREDVAIFDRYIYDELANLPLEKPIPRMVAKFLLWLVPAPEVAYIIDAVPEIARARKPEYPLDFLHTNRERYLALSAMADAIVVVPSASIPECESQVQSMFSSRVLSSERSRRLAPVGR